MRWRLSHTLLSQKKLWRTIASVARGAIIVAAALVVAACEMQSQRQTGDADGVTSWVKQENSAMNGGWQLQGQSSTVQACQVAAGSHHSLSRSCRRCRLSRSSRCLQRHGLSMLPAGVNTSTLQSCTRQERLCKL